MKTKYLILWTSLLLISGALFIPLTSYAERIRDLTRIEGIRSNALMGYGLVVGLDGTGDQTMQTPFTTQSLKNMLTQLGITLPPGVNMQLKNVAAVMVTADLPAFARPGDKIDVVVSSMGNAKSLRGGTLLMTPLKGADSQVYAVAQGHLMVSGALAQGGGSRVQINQLNGGRISAGATVERQILANFNTDTPLKLQLITQDFSTAQRIVEAINKQFGLVAQAEDSRSILLHAPAEKARRIKFLAELQNIQVNVDVGDALIIVNSRTGSVVMNRHVMLDSCAVAQGDLTVEVTRNNRISHPGSPLAGGKTVVSKDTQVGLREEKGALQTVNTSADLNSVVRTLNRLGTSPGDLMAILQSMKSAGCLRARLEME